MKIAGRKNAGAWYRTNKFIKKATAGGYEADLVTVINDIETLPAYITAIADIAAKTGVGVPEGLQTADSFATILGRDGIPEGVWMGTLAFDTYTRTGLQGAYKYKSDHAKEAREFAIDLRAALARFMFARRLLLDTENAQTRAAGNPSGVADATKNT